MGLKYEPALDGLRAMAALAVLARHAGELLAGGGRGVDVFFVLSGFLVTSILLSGRSLTDFYVGRARRLLPALVLFLAAYLVFAPYLLPADDRWREALLSITYTLNYSMVADWRRSGLAHVWSLAVEAQFYLLWPLLLPIIMRARSPAAWLVALWAAMTFARTLAFRFDPSGAYYATHYHATGLLLGAALAVRRWPSNLGWLGLGLILATFVFGGRNTDIWSIPFAEIGAAFLIPAFSEASRLRSVFAWRPAVLVGLISYGVYLWHGAIAYALQGSPWAFPVTLCLSLALATMSYVTVERVARRWRFAPQAA